MNFFFAHKYGVYSIGCGEKKQKLVELFLVAHQKSRGTIGRLNVDSRNHIEVDVAHFVAPLRLTAPHTFLTQCVLERVPCCDHMLHCKACHSGECHI